MRVIGHLWFESPGAMPHSKTYPSIQAVLGDFESMRETHNRFGGGQPVGMVYDPECDYPLFGLELGPRGGIRRVAT